MDSYSINKEGRNKYVFLTDNNVEYQLVIRNSGIVYKDTTGANKNVIELALNCDINTASKDYKTLKTLAKFYGEVSNMYDAIYMQIHNQPESINNGKIERRGVSRIKLWNRSIARYYDNYMLLTNLALCPNKNSDILSILIKKDSFYFKQLITNFYRFCYSKMYKTTS